MSHEIELKLVIDSGRESELVTLINRMCGVPKSQTQLYNSYYDTPDQQLAQQRSALRVRSNGSEFIQTYKTAGCVSAGGLSQRGEWEWPLTENQLDPSLLVPLLGPEVAEYSFEARYRTDFTRTTWHLVLQDAEIELAWDQGQIEVGQEAERSEPISELELELKQGNPDQLLKLAQQILTRIPGRVGVLSKAARAEQLIEAGNTALEATSAADSSLAQLSFQWDSEFERFARQPDSLGLRTLSGVLEHLASAIRALQFSVQTLEISHQIESLQTQLAKPGCATELARALKGANEPGLLSISLAILLTSTEPAKGT